MDAVETVMTSTKGGHAGATQLGSGSNDAVRILLTKSEWDESLNAMRILCSFAQT